MDGIRREGDANRRCTNPYLEKRLAAENALGLMDGACVDAAVIHPPSWHREAIEMAKVAVRNYPDRFAVMGLLSLDLPTPQSLSQACSLVTHWRSAPSIIGLRFSFNGDPAQQRLYDGSLDAIWAAAETAGVPMTTLATDFLADIGRIAKRHPGLRLSIDHLGGRGGSTTLKDAAAMTHLPDLLALAKFPNVAVKATGAPGYSSEAYPFPTMHAYLHQIYDAFGPSRMFWGTDISKMPCSWSKCVTMFTDELPWLGEQDKELIMGEALCK